MPWSSATVATAVENPVGKVDNRQVGQSLSARGPVLGIFAKQPVSGRVKTRLSPPLTPGEARALYAAALRETVASFSSAAVPLVICGAGRRAWFARAFPGIPLMLQGRGDLGIRLERVTTALFAAGWGPVAVAGSDSPDLPPALIAAAFAALADADAAAVPCADGGFALLALHRPAPALFAALPWSTPEILAALRERAARLDLRFATVGTWDDLDDLDALRRLLLRSPECATARHARAHLGRIFCSGCG